MVHLYFLLTIEPVYPVPCSVPDQLTVYVVHGTEFVLIWNHEEFSAIPSAFNKYVAIVLALVPVIPILIILTMADANVTRLW